MSSKVIYHDHHILPKHMGGTDDPSNICTLTIEEHAEAHRQLYEKYGHWQDRCAWLGLIGLIDSSEASRIAMIEGAKKGGRKGCRKIKTPAGVFDSITSAANHYNISKQAVYKKLKKNHRLDWIYID